MRAGERDPVWQRGCGRIFGRGFGRGPHSRPAGHRRPAVRHLPEGRGKETGDQARHRDGIFTPTRQEIDFFQSKGRTPALDQLLSLRGVYKESFGFVLRCFPALVRLHLRTALDNPFPRSNG